MSEVIILAFDTSTSAITAAVHDGSRILAESAVIDTRRHTEALAPMVEKSLQECGLRPADLTHIAVGIGPGPFTGLRVGIVTAVTMGYALGVPVHGICSLDALAAQAVGDVDGELLVASDARRKEVYWARYVSADGSAMRTGEPAVNHPLDLPEEVRALPTVGRGPVLYPEHFRNPRPILDVRAGAIADLAALEIGSGRHTDAVPMYLRRPDAQEPGAPKPTLAGGR